MYDVNNTRKKKLSSLNQSYLTQKMYDVNNTRKKIKFTEPVADPGLRWGAKEQNG